MFPNFIVLLSGKMGSGKDYLAGKLIEKLISTEDLNIYARQLFFSDRLKSLCVLGNYAANAISDEPAEDISSIYNRFYIIKDTEDRIKLQDTGAEFREKDTEVWVKLLIQDIKSDIMYKSSTPSVYIISDCRFPEEIECIQRYIDDENLNTELGVVRIIRESIESSLFTTNDDGTSDIKNHPSETALDDYNFPIHFSNSENEEIFELNLTKLVNRLFLHWMMYLKYPDTNESDKLDYAHLLKFINNMQDNTDDDNEEVKNLINVFETMFGFHNDDISDD